MLSGRSTLPSANATLVEALGGRRPASILWQRFARARWTAAGAMSMPVQTEGMCAAESSAWRCSEMQPVPVQRSRTRRGRGRRATWERSCEKRLDVRCSVSGLGFGRLG